MVPNLMMLQTLVTVPYLRMLRALVTVPYLRMLRKTVKDREQSSVHR